MFFYFSLSVLLTNYMATKCAPCWHYFAAQFVYYCTHIAISVFIIRNPKRGGGSGVTKRIRITILLIRGTTQPWYHEESFCFDFFINSGPQKSVNDLNTISYPVKCHCKSKYDIFLDIYCYHTEHIKKLRGRKPKDYGMFPNDFTVFVIKNEVNLKQSLLII